MVSRAGNRAKETLGNQGSAGGTGARAGSKQHAPSFASECVRVATRGCSLVQRNPAARHHKDAPSVRKGLGSILGQQAGVKPQ